MSSLFRSNRMLATRLAGLTLCILVAAGLGGCGSGAVSSDSAGVASGTPTLTVTLTELTSATVRTSIAFGNPAKVSATIRSGTTPVVGVVVTFTTDATLGTFSPAAGTALTDASGVASVTLSAANFSASGAGTVSAAASVPTSTTPVALSQSLGYSVGAANVTISPVAVQTPALSAFGTTALSVTVSSNGQPTTVPLEVKFTSPCALGGKAALTASASTVNGIANATYRDIGCAAADTITATITGTTLSSSGVVTSAPPAVGSIQFVSAQPTSIALRGTGGVGRQETSLVTFRVVDVAGNPVGGRTVNFTLNTNAGGLSLLQSSAISDAAGLVGTTVSAGSVSTPVRVTASTLSGGQTLSTQSDQLSISTGVPTQGGFSLSVSTSNIEGGDFDGTTAPVTARLADRFSNPVPDGTVVNFTSAGGSIGSTCTTKDGVCTSTLTSQNFRTTNGRVAILAYAIGEESFTDRNGNGWFDISPVNELVDLNGASTDLPEAWLDVNEKRDERARANEPFIDFNNNGLYDVVDGKFNGVSCNEVIAGGSSAGSCSAQKSIHVRGRATVVFSGSVTDIQPSKTVISLAPCTTTTAYTPPTDDVFFRVVDARGNAMPAGTIVKFTTSNGRIVTGSGLGAEVTFTVPNSIACLPGANCPATAPQISDGDGVGSFKVTVRADATQATNNLVPGAFVCINPTGSGLLTVTVTTPSGRVSPIRSITVTDGPIQQ